MAQSNSVAIPVSGETFEIIIIGGGTIGLSAAYYAAARGLKTLLLEQYDQLADDRASSGGYSRMFRIMYSEDYTAKLAEIALTLWHEIEIASQIQILNPQPLIFYGKSGATPEGDLSKMRGILDGLGAPYEWYPSGRALAGAFPVFNVIPPDYLGLAQPNSAVIRTDRSIDAFTRLAKGKGATLLTNQEARVTKTSSPYEVECRAGTYKARSLILAPSAWTNQVLAPFNIQLDLTIWQMTVAYFEASRRDYPLWYEFGELTATHKLAFPRLSMTQKHLADPASFAPKTQALFYGFPMDEKPGHIKVSADFTYNKYTDPGRCTRIPDSNILTQLGNFLQQRFNGVNQDPVSPTTCLYTMSNDFQMILDKLPRYRNVAIFTGDSGRGFKFTPLFGRVLVDLATSGSTYYDISPFSIDRPGIINRAPSLCGLLRWASRSKRRGALR
jgi:monomeric sarcosine oxidase